MSQNFSQYRILREQIDKINKLVTAKITDHNNKKFHAPRSLQQLSQLVTLGQLSTTLSHEIATPLSTVKINLQILDATIEENTEIKTAMLGIEQIDLLIQLFLRQSKQSTEKQEFSTNHEITNSLRLLDYKIKKSKVRIFLDIEESMLYGNPVRFNQVITNLISNSIDAYDSYRGFSKYIYIRTMESLHNFYFYIKDFGVGIKKEDQNKIFNCFYTTKPPLKGTGLGLSISKEIIEQEFLGEIDNISLKHPTIFRITLPNKIQVDN